MIAPLALLALAYGRKKGRGGWANLIILLVMGLTIGMGLTSCDWQVTVTPLPTKPDSTPGPTPTVKATVTAPSGETREYTFTPASLPTETPKPACWFQPAEIPTLIIFGGSGNNASEKGPEIPEFHMTAWKKDYISSYDVFYQRYQNGGKAATAYEANSNKDLSQKDHVALICYSAGTEACLMYAELRKKDGLPTDYIVLLGGSFNTAKDLNGQPASGYDYWYPKINQLVHDGARVLLINDLENETSVAGFKSSDGAYEYHNVKIHHFCMEKDGYPCWRPGIIDAIPKKDLEDSIVDKSPTLRDAILNWIGTGCWSLEENWSPR
jgi:hypothetical protein